jgi:FkbM family methyltransferase
MTPITVIKSNIKWLLKKLFNLKISLKTPTLESQISNACANILPCLSCIDIGASYYPHPSWEVFRCSPNTEWIACDPCKENLNYLQEWRYPCTVFQVPIGLSQNGGQQTLYVTATDSGSSLLPPEITNWKQHRMLMEYFFPLEKKLINTISLSELIQQQGLGDNPFLIKLDTQGTELSILQGLGRETLKQGLIAVEIEVTLQNEPVMLGSSHFYEVQKFFEDLGFELACLTPIEGILPKFNSELKGRSILNECDAVFILRPDIACKKGINYQLSLLGVYIAYKLYGEAIHLIQQLLEQNNLDSDLELNLKNLSIKLK